jgi:hypothetical protein
MEEARIDKRLSTQSYWDEIGQGKLLINTPKAITTR